MAHIISVGEPHPFGILPSEGSCIKVQQGTILYVMVLPDIQKDELEDFAELVGYGVYRTDAFPYGLIIWRFRKNWLIETPFNILKDESEEVLQFTTNDANIMTRVLIDEEGIVRSIHAAGLQWGFIKELQKIWGNSSLDWPEYETELGKVISGSSTEQLWQKTKKYMHEGLRNVSNN